mgnify:CR=1 FL=1
MKTYIYPENLRASVKLWFWSVRDLNHYLCRDSTVCDSACESLEHYPLCSYSLLCFCDCKSR